MSDDHGPLTSDIISSSRSVMTKHAMLVLGHNEAHPVYLYMSSVIKPPAPLFKSAGHFCRSLPTEASEMSYWGLPSSPASRKS